MLLSVALLATAGYSAYLSQVLRAVPTKDQVSSAFTQLKDDLDGLRRIYDPAESPLYEDPADRPRLLRGNKSPAKRTTLREELSGTRQKIFSMVRRELSARHEGTLVVMKSEEYFFDASGQLEGWRSSQTPDYRSLESLEIFNQGPSTIRGLRVVIDEHPAPTSVEEIVAQRIQPGWSEEQKAIALWQTMVEGRRHDWPPHNEAMSAVKLIGVYGYGFCSHAAYALAELAQAAGLSARIRHARGHHVVTEIRTGDHWSMFDADGAVYYRRPDALIASVEDLQRNPELLASMTSEIYSQEKLREIYGAVPFEIRDASPRQPSHRLCLRLRSGESITYSRARRGLFVATRYLEEPAEYANGIWRFKPLLADGFDGDHDDESFNVNFAMSEDGRPRLSRIDPAKEAGVIFSFSLPYPALDGFVEVAASAEPVLQINRGDGPWQDLVANQQDAKTWRFSLADFLSPIGAAPDYDFRVRVSWSTSSRTLELDSLLFQYDLQMAPRSLPFPGPDTQLLGVDFTSDGEARVGIRAAFTQSTD